MRYTNILLTIIAFCLLYQCAKFGAEPSSAANAAFPAGPIQVKIVGKPEFVIAGIDKWANTPLKVELAKSDSPIEVKFAYISNNVPVEIKNSRVPVRIEQSETIPVRVTEMPR